MISCGLFGIVLLVVCSLSVVVTGFPHKNGNSQYWKRMCDGMVEVTDNSTCSDGVWKNPCGKWDCLSGVARECDESRSSFRFGKCADGLLCICERCQGCLKGECYSDSLCFNKLPYSKRINNYPRESSIYSNYNEY